MAASTSCMRIFCALGLFLTLACVTEGKGGHDHGLLPLGWKFGKFPHERYLQKVMRVLNKISWVFPDEDGTIKLFNEKSAVGAAAHWTMDFIGILHDIMDLASFSAFSDSKDRSDSDEDHGHHHRHRHHHRRLKSKPVTSVFDVVATLMKNNVMTLGLDLVSPLVELIQQLYSLLFGNLFKLGHIPGFSDIIGSIVKAGKMVIPGLDIFGSPSPSESKGGRHKDSLSTSSSESKSSEASKSSEKGKGKGDQDKPSPTFITELARAVMEVNPLAHPERYATTILALVNSNIFKDLERTYQIITGKELDLLGPGMEIYQRVSKVTEWIEDTLLPSIDRLAQFLSFPVPDNILSSFWDWPFKILRSLSR